MHDSAGNKVWGSGEGNVLGPFFVPGRDFAWANDRDNNRANQHFTGMTQAELAAQSQGFANPKNETLAGTEINHLVLDWKDTLDFQAKGQEKFQEILKFEKEFSNDPDCKATEIIGSCAALTKYQKLKSKDVEGNQTVLYSTDPKRKETIQIQKYLDWIKNNYGTTLNLKSTSGVYIQ